MSKLTIKFKKLTRFTKIPKKATIGSSGFDLYSIENKSIPASTVIANKVNIGHCLIRTGLILEIPETLIGRIGSRSGMSTKLNLEVGAGWIDSDFRGEIKVELKNFSNKSIKIKIGDRIAQLFFLKTENIKFIKCENFQKTKRGKNGFGSTGTF